MSKIVFHQDILKLLKKIEKIRIKIITFLNIYL